MTASSKDDRRKNFFWCQRRSTRFCPVVMSTAGQVQIAPNLDQRCERLDTKAPQFFRCLVFVIERMRTRSVSTTSGTTNSPGRNDLAVQVLKLYMNTRSSATDAMTVTWMESVRLSLIGLAVSELHRCRPHGRSSLRFLRCKAKPLRLRVSCPV